MNNLVCCPSSGRIYFVVTISAALAVALVCVAAFGESGAPGSILSAVLAALAIGTLLFSLVSAWRQAKISCAGDKCKTFGANLVFLFAILVCSVGLVAAVPAAHGRLEGYMGDVAVVIGALGLVYAFCDSTTRVVDWGSGRH